MRNCVHLLVVLVSLSWAGIGQAEDAPVFYSYKGDSGRTVYVNRFSMVPPEKRSQARAVDLSKVDLHEELAEELADAVEDELRYLKSPTRATRRGVKRLRARGSMFGGVTGLGYSPAWLRSSW